MVIYIIIGIIFIFLIALFLTYNSFIKLENKVKEAFSTMDVYLKKRWDLIPNIVESVKSYAKYEKETLEEIINLRNKIYNEMSNKEKIKTNEQLNAEISKIMGIAEAYPDLKANENFLNLSNQLTKIEDEIANSRKYYNGVVRIYNNKVEMFPSNIVAKLLKFKSKSMFAARENEKENIKINL